MRRSRILASLLLLAWLACGPGGAAAQEVGSIIGRVQVAQSHAPPPPRVQITLHARGMIVGVTYTDNEGYYSFHNLVANPYTLTINEQGYAPVSERVFFRPTINSRQVVNFFLARIVKPKAVAEPAAAGGNPHVVDIDELTRGFPKAARKEFEKGLEEEQEGDAKNAMKRYRKAIEIAPEFYPARNNLGSLLLAEKDFRGAEKQFEEAIRLNSADAAAYFNLANLYFVTERVEEAQKLVEDGLQRQPNVAFGHFLLGSIQAEKKQHDAAEKSLQRALALDGSMAQAHLRLVNVYLEQQRATEAAAQLTRFLEAFPEHPAAPQAAKMLQQLQSLNNPN